MEKNVTVSYLEMKSRADFRPKPGYQAALDLIPLKNNDSFFNYSLFLGVGLPWHWYSRLKWSYQEWEDYLKKETIHTYLAYWQQSIAGYFELIEHPGQEIEIKYFGLLPAFFGHKLGGHLLSHTIDCAWQLSTKRIWLHTCTLDHKNALTNYLARGFSVFREENKKETIPDEQELLNLTQNYWKGYLKLYSK